MAGLSVAESRNILSFLFRSLTFAKRTNTYLGLSVGDPDAGGTEVSGGGYARIAIPVADAQWAAPITVGANEVITNLNQISMGTASAGWGTVTHFMLFDALTSGNMILSGPLGTSRAVLTGDPVVIAVGALAIQAA